MVTRQNLLHHRIKRQVRKGMLKHYSYRKNKSSQSSQIVNVQDLEVLKTYTTDTPLNSACITPKKDFVILGGGQDAMGVTQTSARQGKFEARFYHKIFEEEVGRVRGHFGPLNTVAVDPLGRGYASGGEDGYVRVHQFDKGYFDFTYEVERQAKAAQQQL